MAMSNAEVGDTRTVPVESVDQHDGAERHKIELQDPDGRVGLVWGCDRCGRFFVNPDHFENENCIPWKERADNE